MHKELMYHFRFNRKELGIIIKSLLDTYNNGDHDEDVNKLIDYLTSFINERYYIKHKFLSNDPLDMSYLVFEERFKYYFFGSKIRNLAKSHHKVTYTKDEIEELKKKGWDFSNLVLEEVEEDD